MPTNNSPIWSELWLRASQEEIGIAITFSNNPDYAINLLSKYRPREDFQDYTVCRTEDPNLIYIVRPGVTLEEFNLNDQ